MPPVDSRRMEMIFFFNCFQLFCPHEGGAWEFKDRCTEILWVALWNSQALHSWRQEWLSSKLLKRLLCRVLATTIQDERKESTTVVATRPAACQGELL